MNFYTKVSDSCLINMLISARSRLEIPSENTQTLRDQIEQLTKALAREK